MFEFVEKLNCPVAVEKIKFSGDLLITVLTSTSVIIFDIRSFSILFEIPVEQQIQDYLIIQNTLYYVTKVHSVAYDITTKKQLIRTIKGQLFPVLNQLLIVTPTTLFKVLGNANKQIDVFEYGITSSNISFDRKYLALTSNKLFIYNTQTLERVQVMTKNKVIAISQKYIVCRNIHKNKYEVVMIQNLQVLHQFDQNPPIKCQIIGTNIYYMMSHVLKIFSLLSLEQNSINLQRNPSDFCIHQDTIFLICELDLFVHTLKIQTPKKQKQVPQKVQHSLFDGDFADSFQQQSDFEIKGLINNMLAQHQKFTLLLNHRNKSVSAIYKWFSNNNIKATMFALQKQQDVCVIFDCLKFIRDNLKQIPESDIPLLIRLSGKLIISKYSSHVTYGIQFINLIIRLITRSTQQLLNIKSQLKIIKQSARVQKILRMNIGEQRKQLYEDVYEMSFNMDKIFNLQPL